MDYSMIPEERLKVGVRLNVNHEEVVTVSVEAFEEDAATNDDW